MNQSAGAQGRHTGKISNPLSTPWFPTQSSCPLPEMVSDRASCHLHLLIAIGHESGLYALAIGMVAHPDNTQPVDWSGRSPENTAFARLVYAIDKIRSQHDDNYVKLETLRVENSTMSFQGLASLIAYHNQTMAEPKIELLWVALRRRHLICQTPRKS